MLTSTLQQFIAFGMLGLLIEVLFTGLHSAIIDRNKNAICKTYLHMFFVYGFGALILTDVNHLFSKLYISYSDDRAPITYHIVGVGLAALCLTFTIYLIEFSCGIAFERLLGRCPWKYMDSSSHERIHKASIMGFVRIDYAPFWYILSLLFVTKGDSIIKVVNTLSTIK